MSAIPSQVRALQVEAWWHQPELLTINEATAAQHDVKFTTMRYVLGMLKVPLIPFLAAYNLVVGGPNKKQVCAVGLNFFAAYATVLVPVIAYLVQLGGGDPTALNATEATAPFICMLLASMFGVTANADSSWQLQHESIGSSSLTAAVAGSPPLAPTELRLFLDHGLHHMDAHSLVHPATMLARVIGPYTLRVRLRTLSHVSRMLRALPSAMHRLLALGTYATPSLRCGTYAAGCERLCQRCDATRGHAGNVVGGPTLSSLVAQSCPPSSNQIPPRRLTLCACSIALATKQTRVPLSRCPCLLLASPQSLHRSF